MFENIIGQDRAVNSLGSIMDSHKEEGSYIFLGPDGVGKKTCALEFAKKVNGTHSYEHPDIFTISPEGASFSIKIEAIRDIIDRALLKPYSGKKKVFIIDDADRLLKEAQNAFLKLLEEPPKDNIFILIASNLRVFSQTIVSRCKILKFSYIKKEDIKDFLEKKGYDKEEAVLYSHMAMGSIRKALSFKEEDFISKRDAVINNFFLRNTAIFREDALTFSSRNEVKKNLYILLFWYRDLLVSKFAESENLLFNIDRYNEIFSYSRRFSSSRLESSINILDETINLIERNINPKLALFNMAVKLK